jgi:hypothetical protein
MSLLSAGDHSPKDVADPAPAEADPAGGADGGATAVQISRARPVESPALVLARARIGGALFGDAVGLGRFERTLTGQVCNADIHTDPSDLRPMTQPARG